MARGDFLRDLRMASNLLGHRVHTNVSGLDPHWLENQLVRAGLWLTPSAMGEFDKREFPELLPERRTELRDNVERFIRVTK
jgi:hypothetical protein